MAQPLLHGWKVLSPERESAFTAINPVSRFPTARLIKLHYPKRKRVFPKVGNGPLGVFSTNEWAARFAFDGAFSVAKFLIVPCHYEASCHTHSPFNSPPEGTCFAAFVTCLE